MIKLWNVKLCVVLGCANDVSRETDCDYWSMGGECTANFVDFMNQYCPRSCDTCTALHSDLDLTPLGKKTSYRLVVVERNNDR